MNITKRTSVRYLAAGDVLASSGFTVTRAPYTSTRCPRGRLHVEGFYPGQENSRHLFNASTTVHVVTADTAA